MSERVDPISYAFRWTPDLYAQLSAKRPPSQLKVSGAKWQMLLAALATLVVMMAIAVLPVLLGFFPRDAILALLWGAVATLIAVLLVVIPYVKKAMARADLATRARQGEVHVTLGPDGIEATTDIAYSKQNWDVVSVIAEAPKATLLWIGATMAMPVPDEALPQGVDRAELIRRIAIWRGEGA